MFVNLIEQQALLIDFFQLIGLNESPPVDQNGRAVLFVEDA